MVPEHEPEAPPAGGFGAGAGQRFGPIKREPTPPLSPPQRVFRGAMSVIGVAALVCFVILVLAVLFAGFMYAYRKSIDGRRAEAFNSLGQIGKQAHDTFDERGTLCPSARPVPATPAGGTRYTSQRADWSSDPGWSCLGFEMSSPQKYRYEYQSDATAFTATATPIDGKDAIVFELGGRVVDGHVVVDPSVRER